MTHRCATWFFLTTLLLAPLGAGDVAAQDSLAIGAQDDGEGADVLGAFADSFKLLLIEHAWRIGLQEKTQQELGGKFWLDYHRSVRIPRQWGDTDAGWVNYLGHPIHGAGAGYIWLDHDPIGPIGDQSQSTLLDIARASDGVECRIQPAVRDRPAQRGVNRQRRVAA